MIYYPRNSINISNENFQRLAKIQFKKKFFIIVVILLCFSIRFHLLDCLLYKVVLQSFALRFRSSKKNILYFTVIIIISIITIILGLDGTGRVDFIISKGIYTTHRMRLYMNAIWHYRFHFVLFRLLSFILVGERKKLWSIDFSPHSIVWKWKRDIIFPKSTIFRLWIEWYGHVYCIIFREMKKNWILCGLN